MKKPYVGALHRPISTFVCAGKASDARLVLVNGEIVYRDGAFPRHLDPARTFADAERIGAEILQRTGLDRHMAPAWRQ